MSIEQLTRDYSLIRDVIDYTSRTCTEYGPALTAVIGSIISLKYVRNKFDLTRRLED